MTKLPAWPAVVCDVVCVLVFTLVGTASHASGGSAAHVATVGAPFLVGLGVGWLATRAWRAPAQVWPTGVAVWFATVVLGLFLRPLLGGGFAWSFALVTAVFLAATMLGWRLLAALAARRART
ncbi:Protein of unknown function (DUF3054) [Isoptericola jiangsuensis]|uniref:DUF3054 family protein n=1 Tax=Isoptericola jiangsuensis TaxID=548579 RepID=A0A2A9EWB5_9MICO|nr:DUF3054 domain-containing protein [Isoptericola jiangsuensis]PFG42582.1 Protein of unknown function (DUF3054) [Isoptericola jiangsuensis]